MPKSCTGAQPQRCRYCARGIQEDADALAISSYQGGHNEYFRYLIDQLRAHGVGHVRVVVGGGGTLAPEEIRALEAYGVEKIYTPEDGRLLGLDGMIEDVMRRVASARERAAADPGPFDPRATLSAGTRDLCARDGARGRCHGGGHSSRDCRSAAADARSGPDRHRRRGQVEPE